MLVSPRLLISAVCLGIVAILVGSAQVAPMPAAREASAATLPYGIITTVAGDGEEGYFGSNVPAVSAQFDIPAGVAVDLHGNLYIADYANNMIRVVSASSGEISTIAGSLEGGYDGDGGPAAKAHLSCPNGITVDSKTDIYFSDACHNVVRKIVSEAGVITTVAGYDYMTGYEPSCQFGGDGGRATKAQLCYPAGLATDGAGDLYIADTHNSLVRKVAAGTGIITTVAGDPYLSSADVRDGVPATSVALALASGIAVDSKNNLYVGYGCLVRRVDASTGLIYTVAGIDDQYEQNYLCGPVSDNVLATSSQFEDPSGIALDSKGNLFIDDSGNRLILRVDARSGTLRIVAGDMSPASFGLLQGPAYTGIEGYTGDGGAATVARLTYPWAVAADRSGNIYIADTGVDVIRKVTGTLSDTTAAPVVSPAAGGTGYGFAHSVQVTLSDSDAKARIYFSTDGSAPTTASTLYTGPITLDKTASVIAFATSTIAADSDAAQGNYFKLPAPTIAPDGGSFAKPLSVLLQAPPTITIFFTLDGSDPCENKNASIFDQPLLISSPITLKAVEVLGAGCGPIATANFVIPSPPAVTLGTAANLTSSTATLNGAVNPGTFATSYWFSYGEGCIEPLPMKTPVSSLPAGTTTRRVSANISGLTPGIEYCVQLNATNRDGASSALGSFDTAD